MSDRPNTDKLDKREFKGGPLGGQKRLVKRSANLVVVRWPKDSRLPPGDAPVPPEDEPLFEWGYQRHGNIFILRAVRPHTPEPEPLETND